jgi:hypothetical protein
MSPNQLKKKKNTTHNRSFLGFSSPTSNTVYTPNQFFDVCLPYSSRGVVRLVSLLIRKTLGWCDENGNPQAEQHVVSWSDFEAAGVSRDMIRGAIEEAIAGHFIRCVRQPRAKKAGSPSVSGLYELKWDERPAYVKNPKEFRGFFAGEGNRTYIPNQYFDRVVPNEPLAVVKVVGSVIRFSIGFQNKWGHRRRNASLSYQHIQNFSHIRDRKTLSVSIRHAIKSNYIERVEEGFFDPDAGKLSKAAVYAVKWLNEGATQPIGQKTLPGQIGVNSRSENPTGIGQKTLPEERSENPTDIKIKQRNNISKQQAAVSFRKLRAEGFGTKAAEVLATAYPGEQIDRQIRWLDGRHIKSNRLGMLRSAIEQDWPAPATTRRKSPDSTERIPGKDFGSALSQIERRLFGDSKKINP